MINKTRPPFFLRKDYYIGTDLAERATPVLPGPGNYTVQIVHESGLKETIKIKDKTEGRK